MALTEKLTAVADAIREKTGEVAALSLEAMVEAINGIKAEPETQMATVTLTRTPYTNSSAPSVSSSCNCKYWDGSAWVTKSFVGTNPLTFEVPIGTVLAVRIYGSAATSSGYNSPNITSKNGADATNISYSSYSNSSRYYKDYTYSVVVLEEVASVNFAFGSK